MHCGARHVHRVHRRLRGNRCSYHFLVRCKLQIPHKALIMARGRSLTAPSLLLVISGHVRGHRAATYARIERT